MLDERWIRSLHVESLRRAELHREREPHVLFQASTIGALLDGAFEGDLRFAELAEHGDLGLGTLNGLDGEMIAIDGLPQGVQVVAQLNPLHQLVELVRGGAFGYEAVDILRFAFLVGFALLTWRIAVSRMHNRLID